MWTGNARLSVAVAGLAPLASALLVTTGSPCATYCGNEPTTGGADMACKATDYSLNAAGIIFETCVKCETTSTYSNKNESDLGSLLYNLRYNMGWCLFGDLGNKDAGTNPCVTKFACEPLKQAIEWNNYTNSGNALDYCQKWDSAQVARCSSCLNALPDGYFLNNYVTMLEAACEQKPAVGSTISIAGDPFSSDTPVSIVTPSPTFASVPTPDYGPVSLGARVGIAFGALAAILVIVGFCIVCNGKRRRRRFLRELEQRHHAEGYPHPKTRYGHGGSAGTDMFETPVSQKPLRSWDESPVSAHTEPIERGLPRYFSPYSSTYNSPVSANDGGPSMGGGMAWPAPHPHQLDHIIQSQSPAYGSPPHPQWPSPTQEHLMMQMHHEKRQNEIAIGLALGGDEASLRSKPSNPAIGSAGSHTPEGKGKDRDEYEMQEVESPYNSSSGGSDKGKLRMPTEPDAPVLHHPGFGRIHGSRPGTGSTGSSNGNGKSAVGGLTEDDARRGYAL
ncbi:hypothetical protein B0T19DRAFT_441347 [Cercophora scortea]|uniref:Uncharacterized protein n=1 Tax=Cercophora scortea TaxID=314031 RepID=A0AAE0MCP2_9PEZI|nr:hypothetical protein B0T19DRAFT_441347 [Cercophora scortea]